MTTHIYFRFTLSLRASKDQKGAYLRVFMLFSSQKLFSTSQKAFSIFQKAFSAFQKPFSIFQELIRQLHGLCA